MELPQQSKYQLQTTVDNNEIPQNITHGYTGLRNQGSTCYLNAVLQTLFMTEEFRNAVESSQDKSELSSELAHLFKELKSGKKSVTTENITDVLNIGNVNEQQDAEKWFLRILNMVSSDMSKTFQGIMEYTTICRNEHTSMVQTDHCFSIDISVESHSPINVEYCFDSLFEPVSMCGEDQIYCKTCKNMMNMETNCKIKKFPPVLVLHLERFELDYNAMYYRKNTSRVEIPLQLSVKGERDVCQYDLYAVVKHTGSLRSGHYFADIKSFEDKKWYRFNDCSVYMIPDLKDQKACDEAYLLLYKCK
ncbi:ubiquitin carboxyl-terminal hydrolase 47-like [Megalobrama amblycephala]|uniref:ubiquitin carboxyl-terminal hydrolase 47-like n=1 Tax=Megalobrama amblycephala TaxID=75352 RepID=UPI0020146A6F|nr:ubiquitin carboxyl-terminal hydrolase 47-like [Megalobrama amblycephala]